MRRTLESIRKNNPFTIYGVLMLMLLSIFVGCMTYFAHLVLTDEGPEHEPVPWNRDYAKAWETHDTIKQGLSSPKGDK